MDYEGKRSASAVTAGNTSSASASASRGEYEVFLSFRGKDTRKCFTDYLYTYLVDAGIRTFRDDDELRVGEKIGPELLKAIKESKISIPIFSKDYASSTWCLRELAQMVECHKSMGQNILPIFYDVEPSDVRYQTGSYEEAFRQHKKQFDEKTVQGWKEALREVGDMKGWELEKETNGHQGKLVKMVGSKVLLELKNNYKVITDNMVGIDHHVDKMMGLLNVDSNDVCIVGIHGMGGIGKTTIAKVIYNRLSECFECCCFLADVRETSQQHKGLCNLQNQLISKIRKGKCLNIADVDEGINMIKDTVCRKKVLIVLDDVDEKSQFDKLAGKRDWFGSGSRIIVTTRNKEVLNLLEVDRTYEPQLMEPDHSLQLFSKHAFRRDFPPEDYDILSTEVVSTAAGLPLALEIIGSFLSGKGKAVWEDTLMKLKEIPDEHVQKKLRISYEALNYEQKQIFLDIACFFIGEDKRLPFYMWEDCKFYPTIGIDVLCLNSLVKIGDANMLRMRDQLRDLGRQIVREENFKEPGERSRLFIHEEALDILERRMGTQKVEALCLEAYNLHEEKPRSHCFTDEEFGKLPNLRFLRVDYADLAGDFKCLLSKLRWLQWRKCPGNFTPTNFHLKNLVILDLSYSYIKDDWEAWSQIKMAKKLKVLYLSYCSGLTRTPDFSTFATLEILILEGCPNLVQIEPSIWNLINLRVLNIADTHITKFPDAIGNLEKLEEINASACHYLQGEIPSNIERLSSLRILKLNSTKICSLPTSIFGLSCLQTLDLDYCKELELLPELPPGLMSLRVTCILMEKFPSLSNLMNLKDLMFCNCPSLVEIPRDIGKLSKLDTLTLDRTNISTLPAEIGALSWLKQLQVKYCKNLQCIPMLPSSLFKLHLESCELVERLPDLSNIKQLQNLVTKGCKKLIEIQGFGKLELLTCLDLSMCESLERLPDVSNLGMLKELCLHKCQKLAKVEGLGGLKSLERLDMSGCISLERLPDVSNLGMLKELDLSNLGSNLGMLKELSLHKCQMLAKVEGLGGLKSLERLDASWCTSLKRLPDLSNLGMLKELFLHKCQMLARVEGLGGLKSLERLDASWCTSLERLPDLSNSGMLKELSLHKCQMLARVEGLGGLKSLERLDASCCTSLERLPDLSNSGMLKELSLHKCQMLARVEGLGGLKSLERLDASWCTSLERLPDLSNSGMLKELFLHKCQMLARVEGLGGLKSLERLDASWCTSLERLPDLSNSGMLKELCLHQCQMLAKVEGLGGLKSLERLDASWCTSLERLPDLSNSGMLKELCLHQCQMLAKVEGLGGLKSLERLDASWCTSLERLPDLSNLGMLKELSLHKCQKLAKVEGLGGLKSLERLDVSLCTSLERLPDLSNLGMLKELFLHKCQMLAKVEGLGGLKSLERLDASWCTSLERLPDLSNLGMLKELCLHKCQMLDKVEGLGGLKSLERLDASWCTSLERLPDLSNLGMLKELCLHRCQMLAKVEGLGGLKSLERLDVSWCTSLERLPDLSNLGMLKELSS